jgi:hypothetical protein
MTEYEKDKESFQWVDGNLFSVPRSDVDAMRNVAQVTIDNHLPEQLRELAKAVCIRGFVLYLHTCTTCVLPPAA